MDSPEKGKVFTLGHSPDPDDAFMFYAMAEGKIETGDYRFEHILQDIQTLNERAMRSELDVTAVSIHAYAHVLDRYALLPCGASMGDGYGPILVTLGKEETGQDDDMVRTFLGSKRIAVPGEMTSAYLALRLFVGECNCVSVPFDEIFDAVRRDEAQVGLLIHEGQLTYAGEGFRKVLDLGEWWTRETGLPLPLGGNVVRKEIEPEIRSELARIIRESIRYGLDHRREGVRHSMPLARGMDEETTDQFIGMYVNEYTLDYGEKGRRAIHEFLGAASEEGLIAAPVELEFVK